MMDDKQIVFNFLQKAISSIEENFNSEEREFFLDDKLDRDNFPFEYSIDAGISKAVILIKGAPFVIKMPFFKIYDDEAYCADHQYWNEERDSAFEEFCNQWHENKAKENPSYEYQFGDLTKQEVDNFFEQYDKDHPEPEYNDEYYYDIEGASNIRLENGAEPTIPDWDYCRLETVIYQLDLEEGLGSYFADEGYLGTIDQTPVYYQTRCTPMNSISIDYHSKEYHDKEKKSEKICKDLDIICFNDIWIADFVDYYGIDEFKRLHDFLQRYEIGDLRTCNIGYLDGAPILFDYSGYRDW